MRAYAPSRLFTDMQLLSGRALLVDDGRILGVYEPGRLPEGADVERLDGILAPGYVDVQVNGCGGMIFNQDISLQAVATIAETCRRHGVAAILPTLITATDADIARAFEVMDRATGQVPGVAGMHLEGPYLSVERRGTHPKELVRPLDEAGLERVLEAARRGFLKLFTIAPESVTAGQIRRLAASGVTLSIGHTAADAEDILAAEAGGVRMLTHMFNGMPPLAGRAPGAVGAGLASDGLMASIIVDGAHVSPVAVRGICKALGARIFLISDATASEEMGDRTFSFGGHLCRIDNGVVRNEEGGLAGAAMLLDQVVVTAARILGDVPVALSMATERPARAIGMQDTIGALVAGRVADFNLLDSDTLHVRRVWSGGREISGTGRAASEAAAMGPA